MGLVVGRWILGRTSGIPADFFAGTDDITKERERSWNGDHRTHSIIFDYY